MQNLDLNLLVVFEAIMTERSMTGAARRIGMTQPAVSNAVARMRQVWNDPLFVKQGRGIRPTPYAERLWEKTRAPLLEIRDAASGDQFDPGKSGRVFRIGVTEYPVDMLWLPLRKFLEQEAPGVSLHSVPLHGNTEELLLDASVDLVIHYYVGRHKQIRSSWLFNNHLVCAVRPGHPMLQSLKSGDVLPLEDYLAADHLMVSLTGAASANVDSILRRQGLARRVAMTVTHFAAIPPLLMQTDLVCVTPQAVVARAVKAGELVIVPLSFEIEPAPISLVWHSRQDRDPGSIWMRKLISDFATVEAKRLADYFLRG
ncbi:LysR family transcriptional regulator [Kiloniella laminariae]|uniref:LysR family transcriptional regulator n=1 Tax=Kiloniella laminariae TaxID=454162 RepID=A0ABT4LE55_9PROT|nr:LysR family transcriptional regulator [Kiloniella laminariae]MCZ4279378.1 LysR family transcriptional regulator [Kiloniella laminariae]